MNEKLATLNKGEPKNAVKPFASKDVLASRPKSKRVVAIESDDILEWPNGDIESKKIGGILLDAHDQSLEDSAIVTYLRSQRIKDFDFQHPEWESVTVKTTVGRLKRMYKDAEGCNFDAEQEKFSHVNRQFAVYVYYNPERGILDLVTVGQD
jgi:hypothetical protein